MHNAMTYIFFSVMIAFVEVLIDKIKKTLCSLFRRGFVALSSLQSMLSINRQSVLKNQLMSLHLSNATIASVTERQEMTQCNSTPSKFESK